MNKLLLIKSSVLELTYKDYKQLWDRYDNALRHFKDNYESSNLYKGVFPSLIEESSDLRNNLIKFSNSDKGYSAIKKNFKSRKEKALKQIHKIINSINNNMVKLKTNQ